MLVVCGGERRGVGVRWWTREDRCHGVLSTGERGRVVAGLTKRCVICYVSNVPWQLISFSINHCVLPLSVFCFRCRADWVIHVTWIVRHFGR